MSEFASVLDLARATANEANLIKSGRQAEDTAERVLNRTNETKAELRKLQQAVTAARRLAMASGETGRRPDRSRRGPRKPGAPG